MTAGITEGSGHVNCVTAAHAFAHDSLTSHSDVGVPRFDDDNRIP